ncbi:MAG: ABC transporter permease, partial [Kiritimatiellae bacterium]|nr:ABC transporter permease [Kiritimatiellia bacterium]
MRLNILSHLSPLTRKRLQNFARIRRAVIALALLIGLFVISLFSNFICNSSPLFLRYEGRTYFPFLKSITQADLNGG